MCREFKAMVAGELSSGDKFAFENTYGATIFNAQGVYTSHSTNQTIVELSQDTTLILPYGAALYRVTEPEYIPVTQLSVGDRLFDVDGQIYNVTVVIDGSVLDERLSSGEWTYIGIGNNKWHTHKNDAYVYRYPALGVTNE